MYYSGKNELQYWIAWQIGKINFYVRAVDNVGNKGEISNIFTLGIDKESPSTPTTMNFVFSNWSGYSNNSWTNQDVYAGRTSSNPGPTGSTDNLSGICKYQISSDGSNYRDYAYNSSDSMYYMNTTGTHTRYFRAVDCAGNVGNAISRVARIDKGIPTAPSILGQQSGWINHYQIVWVTNTSSSYSGIKKYKFCDISVNDVSKCTKEDWKDLYANNTGTDSGIDVAYYHAYYSDLISTFNGSTGLLDKHYKEYGRNEKRNTSDLSWVRTAQNISSEGTHYVFFRAVNNAETEGYSSGSQNINIDVTPPSAELQPAGGVYVKGSIISGSCEDSLSGISRVILKDNDHETYNNPGEKYASQTFETLGVHNGSFVRCEDNAGNANAVSASYSIVAASSSASSSGKWCSKNNATAEECRVSLKGVCVKGTVNGANCVCSYRC